MSRTTQTFGITLAAAAAILALQTSPAFSQSTANPPTGNAAANSPTSTQPQAMTPPNSADAGSTATSHAQRKANAKAARAKNKAELSKLEQNGYRPSAQEANYPNNIQNAEKKAGEQ
jgi:hypothetical protein